MRARPEAPGQPKDPRLPEAPRLSVFDGDQGPLDACHAIRRAVFIQGQGVPPEIEVDGRDPQARHVLMWMEDRPVATARARDMGQGTLKVERVAVLDDARGHGLGWQVMQAMERDARGRGFLRIVLGAQVSVIGFYERLGYRCEGPEFMEAGIAHRMMARAL